MGNMLVAHTATGQGLFIVCVRCRLISLSMCVHRGARLH